MVRAGSATRSRAAARRRLFPAVVATASWIALSVPTFGAGVPLHALAQAAERDPALVRGIRHVEAGEWNEGIADLLEVERRLGPDKSRQAEVADAYLYAGIAYAGLGQRSPAVSQFVQALKRNPQVTLDPARASKAAVEAFDEARSEAAPALAARAPKKKSHLGWIVGGAVVVGGAVALAASSGSGSAATLMTQTTATPFSAVSSTGSPQLLLLSTIPPGGSTIRFSNILLNLSFVTTPEPNLPGRLQTRIEMLAGSGVCFTGRSEPTVVDRTAASLTFVVNEFTIVCRPPFTTTTMNAFLFDPDGNVAVSETTFRGGYRFEP